jgi:hypothetical protein
MSYCASRIREKWMGNLIEVFTLKNPQQKTIWFYNHNEKYVQWTYNNDLEGKNYKYDINYYKETYGIITYFIFNE